MLTVVGFLLLVPPVVYLFNIEARILGVPQIVVYLFGVWLALVVGTVLLTRHLPPDRPSQAEEGEG